MSTPNSITGWIIVTPAAVLSILFSFTAVIYYKNNLRSLDFFLLILLSSFMLDVLILVIMASVNDWNVAICTFYVFLWNVLRHGELFTLATMAIDRLLILRRDKFSHDVTPGKVIFITLAWILAIFISALPFSDSNVTSYNQMEDHCNFLANGVHWNYGMFVGIFHIAIILPTIVCAIDVVVNLMYLKKEVMFSLEPEWNAEEMSTPVLNQGPNGRMRFLTGGLTSTTSFRPKRQENQRSSDFPNNQSTFTTNLMSRNLIRSTLLPVVNNNVLAVTSLEQNSPPGGGAIAGNPTENSNYHGNNIIRNDPSWGEASEFNQNINSNLGVENNLNKTDEPRNINIEQLGGKTQNNEQTTLNNLQVGSPREPIRRNISENSGRPPNASLFRELPLAVNYSNDHIPPPPAGGVPAVLLGLPAGALASNLVTQTHERFTSRQNSETCMAVAGSLDNGKTCLLVLFCCIVANHLPYAIIVLIGVITNSSSPTRREVAVWCLLLQALLVFIALWLNTRYRTAYFSIRDFLVSNFSKCACDRFSRSETNDVCLSSYITTREHVATDGPKSDPIPLPSIAVSECSILPVHLWPRRSIQSLSSFRSGNMYRPPSAGSYYMDMEDKISVDLDSDSDWSIQEIESAKVVNDENDSEDNESHDRLPTPHPGSPDASLKSSSSYSSMIYKVE